jgi:hypothetical protein
VCTCMIWSSFLTFSLLGPEPEERSPPSPPDRPTRLPGPSETDLVFELLIASLELFVLVGLVCGEEAGDEILGGCRDC